MAEVIDSFRGRYHFLSNFYPWPGPSVEHHFQAAKTLDKEWRKKILRAKGPGEAKKLGRQAPIREDWEEIKVGVMEDLVRMKFSERVLAADLLATGDALLIEGNTWGDTWWGMVKSGDGKWTGRNELGRILMKIRNELRAFSASFKR